MRLENIRLLSVRALCIVAATTSAATIAAADPAVVEDTDYWRVVEVTGTAVMQAGANPWNEATPLKAGDVVGPYQSIATEADGTAVLTRGEDVIVVYPGTSIALPAPAADQTETHILQPSGQAFYSVDPRPEPEFTVETPYLIAGVKGTEFALTENGAVLEVAEGVVGAANRGSGAQTDVPAGRTVDGAASGQPFTAAALNPAAAAQWSALSEQLEATADARADAVSDFVEVETETVSPGNSNGAGNSGNSNAGGNSGNSNAGGNSNGNGNSGNSNAGGNRGNSNAGGNSGNSNAGGNSNGNGNSGNSNAGGNGNGNGNN